MTLCLYNTLSGRVEPFIPINPPDVTMYVCGVTVYDDCHMGHARAYVAFDLLKRVLTQCGYRVKHIQNFTDIDDKIIDRAQAQGESTTALTQRYIAAYHRDMGALGIIPAEAYPKATDYMPQMIDAIARLIATGGAYHINGTVYFRVGGCATYGELSNKDVSQLQSGARVEVDPSKAHPMDFVLWKPSKVGEPSWDSPWGPGRPGWHTECVAMVHATLGEHIDIHGGGADLVFPHHENELAQAKCLSHAPFANVWVHNGFIMVNDQKMSKSVGNFFTLRDVFSRYEPAVLRYFLLKTHYRAPISYSTETIDDAHAAYTRLASVLDRQDYDAAIPASKQGAFEARKAAFWQALYADLNVSVAIEQLFGVYDLIHAHGCGVSVLRELGQAIGLFDDESGQVPTVIRQLAADRIVARRAKAYERADQLRWAIGLGGYDLEDTRDGGYHVHKRHERCLMCDCRVESAVTVDADAGGDMDGIVGQETCIGCGFVWMVTLGFWRHMSAKSDAEKREQCRSVLVEGVVMGGFFYKTPQWLNAASAVYAKPGSHRLFYLNNNRIVGVNTQEV
jgi:cysteinyl-tRNA synthetase